MESEEYVNNIDSDRNLVTLTARQKIRARIPDSATGGGEFCELQSRPCPQGSRPTLKSSPVTNRTQLKQLLSREFEHEKEKKEKEQGLAPIPEGSPSNFGFRSPAMLPLPVTIPEKVLDVKSVLQHPTRYHVTAKKNSQIREFMQSRLENVPSNSGHTAFGESTVQTIEAQVQSGSVPESGIIVASGSDIIEEKIIDDVLELEEEKNFREIPVVDAKTAEVIRSLLKSASYPQVLALEVEQKEKNKKEIHNKIERNRREVIKQEMERLTGLVPSKMIPSHKKTKGTILKGAGDYINKLEDEVNRLKKEVTTKKELEKENNRLLFKIHALGVRLEDENNPVEIPLQNTATSSLEQQTMMDISPDPGADDVQVQLYINEGQPVEDEAGTLTNQTAKSFLETVVKDMEMETSGEHFETEDDTPLIRGDPMLSSPEISSSGEPFNLHWT